jgi:hypothetical protein
MRVAVHDEERLTPGVRFGYVGFSVKNAYTSTRILNETTHHGAIRSGGRGYCAMSGDHKQRNNPQNAVPWDPRSELPADQDCVRLGRRARRARVYIHASGLLSRDR